MTCNSQTISRPPQAHSCSNHPSLEHQDMSVQRVIGQHDTTSDSQPITVHSDPISDALSCSQFTLSWAYPSPGWEHFQHFRSLFCSLTTHTHLSLLLYSRPSAAAAAWRKRMQTQTTHMCTHMCYLTAHTQATPCLLNPPVNKSFQTEFLQIVQPTWSRSCTYWASRSCYALSHSVTHHNPICTRVLRAQLTCSCCTCNCCRCSCCQCFCLPPVY